MKKYIIGFILGAVIFGSLGVVSASILYQADEVGFEPNDPNWNVNNIEEALNDLYNNSCSNNSSSNNSSISLELKNGCEIRQDEENEYYFYFDGVDDYVELGTIPETVNWADGVTIEFTAKWDALNNYSRIFDFAVAARNNEIGVANYSNQSLLALSSYVGSTEYFIGSNVQLTLTNKSDYKIIAEKVSSNSFNLKFYQDGELVATKSSVNGGFSNAERTKNYLGISAIRDGGGYFKGRIYRLKIDQADGTNIVDIDASRVTQ